MRGAELLAFNVFIAKRQVYRSELLRFLHTTISDSPPVQKLSLQQPGQCRRLETRPMKFDDQHCTKSGH